MDKVLEALLRRADSGDEDALLKLAKEVESGGPNRDAILDWINAKRNKMSLRDQFETIFASGHGSPTDGMYMLTVASEGTIQDFEYLLQKGANFNIEGVPDITMLLALAAMHNPNTEVLTYLISKGAKASESMLASTNSEEKKRLLKKALECL